MLEVVNLTAGYGAVEVLHDVSLRVSAGDAVAILGPNGAGKTTLIRAVSGFLRPWRGKVLFEGRDVGGAAPHTLVHGGLSQVLEGRQIFGPLTVIENLWLGAYTRTDRAGIQEDIARVYVLFPILQERATQRAGTLSGGEQMMLAIGRALMSRPRLLLLDEPSTGLAPLVVKSILEALGELRRSGLTMLIIEQNPDAALAVASRGYVLELGRIRHEASADALKADTTLAEHYLGLSEEHQVDPHR